MFSSYQKQALTVMISPLNFIKVRENDTRKMTSRTRKMTSRTRKTSYVAFQTLRFEKGTVK